MKQVCPVDWDTVRKKFQIESFGVDSETLSKMARLGFWGKALTTDPLSLSSAMAVWGAPFRTDVFLSASSEADAEALLSALEKGREYFFSFNSKYPWRKVIERKLSGGYVGRKLRCKVSKKKFNPQVIYEVIKLDEEHKDIVKSYPDDDMARKHILINSLDMGLPCFGVVVEGKLVSICCTSPFRRNKIEWVYTLETFRDKGYGKSVVSAAVIDILEKEEATYDVDDNNIASIKLCESLGFTPYDETLYFTGRPI